MTNYRYIYRITVVSRYGVPYDYFNVRINREYKYCTRYLKHAEEFVLRYAEKNNLKNIYK